MNTERKYTGLIVLYKVLPTDVIRYALDFIKTSSVNDEFSYLINRMRKYKIKGNKANLLAFIKREWRWSVNYLYSPIGFGMEQLVISQMPVSPNWKWRSGITINQVITGLLDANDIRLYKILMLIENYLKKNNYV